jgi:HEAT repeat protein
MKPVHAAILCLACGFGGAALAFLVQPERPAQQVAATPAPDDARLARVEDQLAGLDDRIAELQKLKANQASAPVTEREQPAEETDTTSTKPGADTSKLDELAERVKEIEKGDEAARKLREDAALKLMTGNDGEQEEAAYLLGKLAAMGDEDAKKALREAMKSADADTREWAIEGLNGIGLVEFLPELKLLMNDPEPDVREEVAQTLASMPADQAGPLLVAMLSDKEPDVLVGAIEVLGELGYQAAATDLLPLTRHADEEVALEAAIAMRHCGDPSAAEALVPTIGAKVGSGNADERRRALRTLRQMDLESCRSYFEQALNDSDGRVRREAERGLAELNE